MLEASVEYIAVGGNRHSAAADWDTTTGLVAFGSNRNVALWKPMVSTNEATHLLTCADCVDRMKQSTVCTVYSEVTLVL